MIPGTPESAVELSGFRETLPMHSVRGGVSPCPLGWEALGLGLQRGSGTWLYWEHPPLFTITGANRLING